MKTLMIAILRLIPSIESNETTAGFEIENLTQ